MGNKVKGLKKLSELCATCALARGVLDLLVPSDTPLKGGTMVLIDAVTEFSVFARTKERHLVGPQQGEPVATVAERDIKEAWVVNGFLCRLHLSPDFGA